MEDDPRGVGALLVDFLGLGPLFGGGGPVDLEVEGVEGGQHRHGLAGGELAAQGPLRVERHGHLEEALRDIHLGLRRRHLGIDEAALEELLPGHQVDRGRHALQLATQLGAVADAARRLDLGRNELDLDLRLGDVLRKRALRDRFSGDEDLDGLLAGEGAGLGTAGVVEHHEGANCGQDDGGNDRQYSFHDPISLLFSLLLGQLDDDDTAVRSAELAIWDRCSSEIAHECTERFRLGCHLHRDT